MKRLLLTGLLSLVPILGFTRNEENATLCYSLNNDGKLLKKAPCLVKNEGGTGVNALSYTFGGKTYEIVDENGVQYFTVIHGKKRHEEKVKTYLRDDNFNITQNTDDFKYFCYQSTHAHFCTLQK